MRNERQSIVDLIDHILGSQPPIEIDPDTDPVRGRLANQLIKEKYLDGGVAYDGNDLPAMIAILDVTIKGRRLRDELAEELRNARISTKFKKGLVYLLSAACGLVGGILAAIVTAIILRRMGI